MLLLSLDGMIIDPCVIQARRLAIEKIELEAICGLIVHQTGGSTAQSTLNSYLRPGANGAHLLIDKDGTIYQTASLKRQTWHVGPLKSRCVLEARCTAVETKALKVFSPSAEHQREKLKKVPDRFPSNVDSLGIELVGAATKDPTNKSRDPIYEEVTSKQNESLSWLVQELTQTFNVPMTEIFRHPEVSRKAPTEASTARW